MYILSRDSTHTRCVCVNVTKTPRPRILPDLSAVPRLRRTRENRPFRFDRGPPSAAWDIRLSTDVSLVSSRFPPRLFFRLSRRNSKRKKERERERRVSRGDIFSRVFVQIILSRRAKKARTRENEDVNRSEGRDPRSVQMGGRKGSRTFRVLTRNIWLFSSRNFSDRNENAFTFSAVNVLGDTSRKRLSLCRNLWGGAEIDAKGNSVKFQSTSNEYLRLCDSRVYGRYS